MEYFSLEDLTRRRKDNPGQPLVIDAEQVGWLARLCANLQFVQMVTEDEYAEAIRSGRFEYEGAPVVVASPTQQDRREA